MQPAHFKKGLPEWNHFLDCDKEPHKFSLSCGGHDELDDVGNGEDWAIEGRYQSIFRKHDVGTSLAACSGYVEVCHVGVCSQDHATGSVDDAIIGVGGHIVQELGNGRAVGF